MKRRLSMLVVMSLALSLFGCDEDDVVKISIEDNSNAASAIEETIQDVEDSIQKEVEADIAEVENKSEEAEVAVVDTNEISDAIASVDSIVTEDDLDLEIDAEFGDLGDDVLSIMYADYMNLLDAQKCANLYTHISEVSNIPSIGGSYSRTNVDTTYAADLDISNVTSEGFDFVIEAYRGANSGRIEDHASFVSEVCAVSRLSYDDSQYIVFIFNGEDIAVYASGDSGELGLGMGVTVVGDYVTGEATYTNANVINELYTADQLEVLKLYLEDEYYEIFETTTSNGVVTVEEESDYTIVSAFVSGIANQYGYGLVISDGNIQGIEFADGTTVLIPSGC